MKGYQNFLNKEKVIVNIIYIILVFAIFSDILRIPGSAITFFRLTLPVSVGIIAFYPYWCKRFLVFMAMFTSVSVVQNILFYKVIHPELSPVPNNFIKTWFLYFCIILIFFLVKIVQMIEREKFNKMFVNFIIYTGAVVALISILNFLNPSLFSGIELDNPNNYGCCIAALLPFVLVKVEKERKPLGNILLCLILFMLVANDAKASLFGAIVQIAIFLAIFWAKGEEKNRLQYRYILVGGAVIIFIVILLANPTIHGYTLQGTILEPIERLVQNNPYPVYTTSITYRTNTTIYAIWELIKTGAIGLGIGNTGVLLKSVFPNLNPEYQLALNSPILSLHNSWLEFALDIGLVVLIIYILAIGYALKLFFGKTKMTQVETIRTVYILSFPIWVLGPSGVYTLYYLMITIAFLVFADNNEKVYNTVKYDKHKELE